MRHTGGAAIEGMAKIILASASPRRKELLGQFGIKFETVSSDIAEVFNDADPFEIQTENLALLKAREISQRYPEAVVIGADTIVVYENHLLTKPKDKADALRMLKLLNGQTHAVITGVAVVRGNKEETGHEKTWVTFNQQSISVLERYIETGEPMDKAGCYGIQGCGSLLVESIQGNYSNVVGLPLPLVNRLLTYFQIQLL